MELQAVLGTVPLTTIVIVLILFFAKREIFDELIDMQSAYFEISRYQFLVFAVLITLAGMIVCGFIVSMVQRYLQHRQQQQAAEQIYESERNALISIFEALNGRRWIDKTYWCSDQPLHRWKGVKLNPETKRVNKLILPDNDLEGEIPECIGVLQELIEIDFRRNKISGPIPTAFLSLRKLEGLYLYENYMTGEVPLALSELPNLAGIYLFNNNFTNAPESAVTFRERLPPDCYVFI
jgi:hypothetical protein